MIDYVYMLEVISVGLYIWGCFKLDELLKKIYAGEIDLYE